MKLTSDIASHSLFARFNSSK